MRRNRETDTEKAQKTTQKKRGGYRKGELPVAIATAGTPVQSPRQCMVARERFWRREKGVWQEVALFPYDSGFGLDGRHYTSVRFSYEHGFHILRTFLFPLGVSVCACLEQ